MSDVKESPSGDGDLSQRLRATCFRDTRHSPQHSGLEDPPKDRGERIDQTLNPHKEGLNGG